MSVISPAATETRAVMIVTCPACDTRYTVPDDQLGDPAGRQVRCANCGNVWRYSAEAAAIHASLAETAATRERSPVVVPTLPPLSSGGEPIRLGASDLSALAPVDSGLVAERDPPSLPRAGIAEVSLAPPPEPMQLADTSAVASLSRPSVAVELPSRTRRRGRYLVEFALVFVIFLIAALLLGAVFARERITQLVPMLAPVLAGLTEPPTAGLSVTVSASRNGDALTIDGDITNSANAARHVPRLRVTLRDGSKDDVDAKEIDPPVTQLAPGARAHFTTVFDHPNATATSVAAAFAER